jgi:transcriptional regulator with XRE-family HTH domain
MTPAQQANYQHCKVLVLLLKQVAEEKGITQQQIAERTGLLQSNVARIFSLRYLPSLLNFIAIARAVGVNFFFEDKESQTDLSLMMELAMEELGRRPDKIPKN